jgi:dTDP-4-amino-4,6-dideoxygalactose transaminase
VDEFGENSMEKYKEIVKFIRQLYNEPDAYIPLHAPVFNGNEKKYLEECIDSTFVSSVGKFVDRFEEDIARFTGAKKAVVCVNGTNALHLALMLAGVERDDEVITQPLTFIATANAISYCGAHPVFVDIDKDTLGLSPEALKTWLQKNVEMREMPGKNSQLFAASGFPPLVELKGASFAFNKTTNRCISACIPMHTYGHPCRIDEIAGICKQYNIELVEDAAESLGSFFREKHTGTFGKIGVLSFNGNKIITTGGGGMLLFNDEELAEKAKHLTTQAKVPHPWEFIHDQIGYNYRMPNINAALGVAQMEQIDSYLAAKRQLAEKYKNFFAQSEIQFIPEPENARSNYWLNCILLPNRHERDAFLKYANEHGIMTRPVWELMNRLPMFKNAQCGHLSNSEWIADRLVNISSSVIV